MPIHTTLTVHRLSLITLSLLVTTLFLLQNGYAQEGPLFYIDQNRIAIRNSNLDGSEDTFIIANDNVYAADIALDSTNSLIFWTSSSDAEALQGSIGRANLDGTGMKKIVTGLSKLGGIASDPINGVTYWVDKDHEVVQSASYEGTDITTVLPFAPEDIEVDASAGKLYWIIDNLIQRANLDGTEIEVLLDSPGTHRQLALDVEAGKMYWVDNGSDNILRANLDGSNVEELVSGFDAESMALDLVEQKLYWSIFRGTQIQRSNLDGTEIEDVLSGSCENAMAVSGTYVYCSSQIITRFQTDGTGETPFIDSIVRLIEPGSLQLDVTRQKLYWADPGLHKLQRANLDGSMIEEVVIEGFDAPEAFHLDETGGHIYWTEQASGRILRAELDGSNPQVLFEGDPGSLSQPAVDSEQGWVYWIDRDVYMIRRLSLNSGIQEDLFETDPSREFHPLDIAFDPVIQRIIWTDRDDLVSAGAWSANLDGSDRVIVGSAQKGYVSSPRLDPAGGVVFVMVTDDNYDGQLFRSNITHRYIKRIVEVRNRAISFALDWAKIPMEHISGFALIRESERLGRFTPILDGSILDADEMPSGLEYELNIEADVTRMAESVAFFLDGKPTRIENEPPYALFGDVEGTFASGSFTSGVHELTAIAYSEDHAKGRAGEPVTISFTVLNGFEIKAFEVYKTPNGPALVTLTDGAIIDLADSPTGLTVLAIPGNKVHSVFFELQPVGYTHTETVTPYSLWGDNGQSGLLSQGRTAGGQLIQFEPGAYTLKAVPYQKPRLGGKPGPALEVSFEVINSALTGKHGALTMDSEHLSSQKQETWETALGINYPNPFNPITTIRFTLEERTNVKLVIFDTLGREVATLFDDLVLEGAHEVQFDAGTLPSGLYFYRLETPEKAMTNTMLLIK